MWASLQVPRHLLASPPINLATAPGQLPPRPHPAPEATWRPSVFTPASPLDRRAQPTLTRPRVAPGPRLCLPTPPRQAEHLLGVEGEGGRGDTGTMDSPGLRRGGSEHCPACLASVGTCHQLRWGCLGHPVPGGPSPSLSDPSLVPGISVCVYLAWASRLPHPCTASPRRGCTHSPRHPHTWPGTRAVSALNE